MFVVVDCEIHGKLRIQSDLERVAIVERRADASSQHAVSSCESGRCDSKRSISPRDSRNRHGGWPSGTLGERLSAFSVSLLPTRAGERRRRSPHPPEGRTLTSDIPVRRVLGGIEEVPVGFH